MQPRPLTCRELVELVTDYLEGALDPQTVRDIEGHLLECEGCVAYIDQMRTTVALTSSLADEGLPAAVEQRLVEAFRRRREASG